MADKGDKVDKEKPGDVKTAAEEKEERKQRKKIRKEKQEARAEAKRQKEAKKNGGTNGVGITGADGDNGPKIGEADISELRAGVVPGNMSKKQRKAAAAAKEAAEAAAVAAAAEKKRAAGDDTDSSSERRSAKKKKQKKQDDRVWVQCNTCDKWRALPADTDSSKLPDIWVCSLNTTDKERNHCEAPEEIFDEEDVELKAFTKTWVKRLRNADRIESKLSNTAATLSKGKIAKVNSSKGQRGKVDVDWIQCSNPSCGKWRAVSRGLDTKGLLSRMERGKFRDDGEWFCSMNNWDETTASCAAPQEQLWNTRWNLD